ncbi:hypothetical protein [Rhodopseudomonas palustris]|uniref:hypothetical protein n=1 Tax=Rhodopseudomonas palustris TaxID=1076 RepID=UPI0006423DCB|nr:hypothetical protein [Rhodopseudomonas palustris]
MQVQGFALINSVNGQELAWWPSLPERIDVPGSTVVVFGATEAWSSDEYRIEVRAREQADPPDIDPNLPAPVVPISRRQLLLELMAQGIISSTEAVAAAQTGAVPSLIQEAFNSLPEVEQPAAAITWATMSQAERQHPLILLLQAQLGLTDIEVDEMFRSALLR